MKAIRLAVAASVMLMPGAVAAETGSGEGWDYEWTIYGWLKGVKGESNGTELDLDFWDDIVDRLEGAFMTSFEAERGLLTLFAQYEYSKIAADGKLTRERDIILPGLGLPATVSAAADVEVEDKQHTFELGAGYTLSETRHSRWQILGGAKYFDYSLVAELKNVTVTVPGIGDVFLGGRKTRSEDTWWHPFLGGAYTRHLSDSWRLRLRGDYGRLDADNTSWMAEALLDWRFNDWGALEIGYRHLEIDYDNGSNSDSYTYDIEESGPRVGLIVHF